MTPRSRNAARKISGRRLEFVGAKARTRTADRTIFSRELYQLSYLGEREYGNCGDFRAGGR